MKKKFLLFDFDGTIADTWPVAENIIKKVGKEFGYDLKDEDVKVLRTMAPLDIILHFKFPPWKIPKLVDRVREELATEAKKIKLIPGIEKPLLDLKFKNYRMGILTSNLKETVDKFLLKNQLLIFDLVVYEPGIFQKSKSFQKILKENNLNAKDVIYVGDEVRDIDFARESGIKIISVGWGFNKKEVLLKNKPDYFAENPSDLKKILKNS